jgi:hypothetical protein
MGRSRRYGKKANQIRLWQPSNETHYFCKAPGFNRRRSLELSELLHHLDGLGRQSLFRVVHKYPPGHSMAPMDHGTSEVLVDLGQKPADATYLVWPVDLKNGGVCKQVSIAFQVSRVAMRPDTLELCWEHPFHHVAKEILEGGPAALEKPQFELTLVQEEICHGPV